ncbi:hypothetical protein E2320_010636 [Naja naja]|nr:hypothetical protein E2320_010636 [Naja naja]
MQGIQRAVLHAFVTDIQLHAPVGKIIVSIKSHLHFKKVLKVGELKKMDPHYSSNGLHSTRKFLWPLEGWVLAIL